jgi:hypothetical protein
MALPALTSLTGGGGLQADLGSTATSGDVYSTTNATQGGLTINKGLNVPDWAKGAAIVGAVLVGGVYVWRKI